MLIGLLFAGLALASNQYAEWLNASFLDERFSVPAMPDPFDSALQGRMVAEDIRYRVWALTHDLAEIETATETEIRNLVEQQIDYLCDNLVAGRWWWEGSGRDGDPNTDRFILAPLMSGLWELKKANVFDDERISGWLDQLQPAVDFQLNHYGQRTQTDWSTRLSGAYPNIDATYAAGMGAAGELYDSVPYRDSAELFVGYILSMLLPGGSVPYTSNWTDAAVTSNAQASYTRLVLTMLAQHYLNTHSAQAYAILGAMSDHFEKAWLRPGFPENTTSPAWKHAMSRDRMGLAGEFEILAGVSGNSVVRSFAEEQFALDRLGRTDAILGLEFLDESVTAIAPTDDAMEPDEDIGGFRTRTGPGSWRMGTVGSLGPCQDSLVGVLSLEKISDSSQPGGYYINARGLTMVSPEVGLEPLDLSESLLTRAAFVTGQSYSGSSLVSLNGDISVMGAQYRPRQQSTFLPENPETAWNVQQIWLSLGEHMIGRVAMESVDSVRTDDYVRMRIRTEQKNSLFRDAIDSSLYNCRRMRIRILDTTFPYVTNGNAQVTDGGGLPDADEIFLQENEVSQSTGGLYYETSIHVRDQSGSNATYQKLDRNGFAGFRVTLDGTTYDVWLNTLSTNQTLSYSLPTSARHKIYITGERAQLLLPSSSSGSLVNRDVPGNGVVCISWKASSGTPGIDFGAPGAVPDDFGSAVLNSGEYISAINIGNGGSTVSTINGVTFYAGGKTGGDPNMNNVQTQTRNGVTIKITPDPYNTDQQGTTMDAGVYSNDSSSYDELYDVLKVGFISSFGSAGSIDVEISGLTPGKVYRMQTFHIINTGGEGSRDMVITDGTYTNDTFSMYYAADGTTITSAVAVAVTFVADQTNKTFQLLPADNDRCYMNALSFFESPASAYELWLREYPGLGAATNMTDNLDNDRLDNLSEWALGGDPTDVNDAGLVPVFKMLNVGGTNCFQYIHAQRSDAAELGLSYHLEWSDNLVSTPWTNDNYEVVGTNVTGEAFDYVTNRIFSDVAAAQFLKLVIESF